MKRFLKRSAFTIIEMVIVIAVIGILATVMIPTISGMIEKANKSADTQFAASLTIQLAMESVDGGIKNESDLRDAVNKYYGKWLDEEKTQLDPDGGDYYNTQLKPKSSKSGNYFWYDYTNGTVFVGTVKEATEKSEEIKAQLTATASVTPMSEEQWWGGFSDASLRSDLVKGLYLMGCGGKEGDLVDVITQFEGMNATYLGSDYQDAIAAMYELQDACTDLDVTDPVKMVVDAFVGKVETTSIVTPTGAYRYKDVNAVTNVYITMDVTSVSMPIVFSYDPAGTDADNMVDEGVEGAAIGGTSVIGFELPENVTVEVMGLLGFRNPADTTPLLSNTTTIYVDATEADLNRIFKADATDCVIQLPNGSRYVIENGSMYPLPRKDADGNDVPPVFGDLSTDGANDLPWEITVDGEDEDFKDEGGKLFLVNGKLYVAIDITGGTFDLGITTPSLSGYATWTSGNEDLITIDEKTGAATLVAGADFENASVVLSASVAGGTPKTITVYVDQPLYGSFELNDAAHTFPTNTPATFDYIYSGSDIVLDIKNLLTGYEHGMVECDDDTVSFTVSGDMFSREGDKLTLIPDNIDKNNGTVTITFTCGSWLDATSFTVTVVDETTNDFQQNWIEESSNLRIGASYLFRVGNSNAVPLNKLFMNDKPAANITVEIYDGTANYGEQNLIPIYTKAEYDAAADKADYYFHADKRTYNFTKTEWENGTASIRFYGTGVAILKIGKTGDDLSKFTTLAVEVVAAKNITKSDTVFSGSVVLLENITVSSNRTLSNSTLYGNGFTISAPGFHTSDGSNGIITLKNSNIDNVRIVGDTYDVVGFSGSEYFSNAVNVSSGTCRIMNSYIYGCRSPIRVNGGNLELVDSTLDGGAFANLNVDKKQTVLLENVTTVQSVREGILGLGVYFQEDGVASQLTIKGYLKQYNWISKSQIGSVDEKTQAVVNLAFSQEDYKHNVDGIDYINLGIIYGGTPTYQPVDNRSSEEKSTAVYEYTPVSSGAVFSYTNDNPVTKDGDRFTYKSSMFVRDQAATAPVFDFDYSKAEVADKGDKSGYCQYVALAEGNRFNVFANKTSGFNFNADILTVTKHNTDLVVGIVVKNDDTGVEETWTSAFKFTTAGDYTIIYTCVDRFQFDDAGTRLPADNPGVTYVKTVKVSVTVLAEDAKETTFKFSSNETKIVTIDNINYVMPSVTSTSSSIGSLTVGTETIYYPIVTGENDKDSINGDLYRWHYPFAGVELTTYDANNNATTYKSDSQTIPANFTVVKQSNTGTFDGNRGSSWSTFSTDVRGKYGYYTKFNISNGTGADAPATTNVLKYTFTDSSGKVWVYYTGYTFAKVKKISICVTPDTLITLADGTQKRIDELTYDDRLLAWNMFTGKYEETYASYIISHGDDVYRIIDLEFSDGAHVRIQGEHGFLDANTGKWVFINEQNAATYIGHEFIKQDGDTCATVKLTNCSTYDEYTGSYSIASAKCLNVITNGVLSITPVYGFEDSERFYNFFTMGENLQYDQDALQADIEKYGLFEYEDLAEYMTIEEFNFFKECNGCYWKIAVEKGIVTIEELLGALSSPDLI